MMEWLLSKGVFPTPVLRWAIDRQLADFLRVEAELDKTGHGSTKLTRIQSYTHAPLALSTDDANEQHYEVPADFYTYVLGKHLKYSSGFWPDGCTMLSDAENAMLERSCKTADLHNGQDILELGCGWGSLTLFMAAKYPKSNITAISNSSSQKAFIDQEAATRGLNNITVITANMLSFEYDKKVDRIVSIEMFEHMRNYKVLFKRVASWLKPDGKVFIHVFCHKSLTYTFDSNDQNSWMAQHFFSDGLMPSYDLFAYFQDDIVIREHEFINGMHYSKTCTEWLRNMDANESNIMPLFRDHYKKDARKMWHFWRLFFLVCERLFGYAEGNEWGVGHYVFEPKRRDAK